MNVRLLFQFIGAKIQKILEKQYLLLIF